MRLVVDTNVLVGELLRVAGRTRLGDKRIELFLPEQMWGESQVELPRRIAAVHPSTQSRAGTRYRTGRSLPCGHRGEHCHSR